MQKVTIIGNICKDPEINNGVAKFSVAVNEKYNGKESTEFFNCVAFKATAENVCKFLSKGSKCYVEGKQSTNEYEGKRYTSLLVHNVEFLDSKPKAAQVESEIEDEDLSDLPF